MDEGSHYTKNKGSFKDCFYLDNPPNHINVTWLNTNTYATERARKHRHENTVAILCLKSV